MSVKFKFVVCTLLSLILNTVIQNSVSAQSARPRQRFLPPCQLDSFVANAGRHAEDIYGDEGINGMPPPLAYFTNASRINAGIMDQRDAGLTTGHGSYMPNASGKDEYLAGGQSEWDLSGSRGHSSLDNMDGNVIIERYASLPGLYSYNADGSVASCRDGAGKYWYPRYNADGDIYSWGQTPQ